MISSTLAGVRLGSSIIRVVPRNTSFLSQTSRKEMLFDSLAHGFFLTFGSERDKIYIVIFVDQMDETLHLERQPKVIIFDCDGVLFDSRKANQYFYNHLLELFGKPPMTENDLSYVHMHTAGDAITFLFGNNHQREAALAYAQEIDYTQFINLMVVEPGLTDLLTTIRPKIKTAVSTNRSTTIGPVLKAFALEHFFDLVVGSLDVTHPKPNPESVEKILAFFRVGPEQCLYIGDSEVDLLTANNAGVPFGAYKNQSLSAKHHIPDFFTLKEGLLEVMRHEESGFVKN